MQNKNTSAIIKSLFGEIAQLARASGSYPEGRGFDPLSRYHMYVDPYNIRVLFCLIVKLHNWYDKDDKYIDVVNDMYEDNVLDDNDIKDLKLSKTKDDFER